MSSSSLSEGDTVVVVGATGRIGKLVADKLLESDKKYRVRLIANNAAMAEEYVGTGAEGIFVGGLGRVPADETPTLLDISRKGMGECVNTQIANTHMDAYTHTHHILARTHARTHTYTHISIHTKALPLPPTILDTSLLRCTAACVPLHHFAACPLTALSTTRCSILLSNKVPFLFPRWGPA